MNQFSQMNHPSNVGSLENTLVFLMKNHDDFCLFISRNLIFIIGTCAWLTSSPFSSRLKTDLGHKNVPISHFIIIWSIDPYHSRSQNRMSTLSIWNEVKMGLKWAYWPLILRVYHSWLVWNLGTSSMTLIKSNITYLLKWLKKYNPIRFHLDDLGRVFRPGRST